VSTQVLPLNAHISSKQVLLRQIPVTAGILLVRKFTNTSSRPRKHSFTFLNNFHARSQLLQLLQSTPFLPSTQFITCVCLSTTFIRIIIIIILTTGTMGSISPSELSSMTNGQAKGLPYRGANASKPASFNVDEVLSQLTNGEKASLISGTAPCRSSHLHLT
jgi:hypothetical protein